MTVPSRPARGGTPLGRHNLLGQTIRSRGAETRRRLLEATEELLETTPLRDLRIAHIVRRAKTSPATFYVYFNDVSDAVLELIEGATQSPPKLLAMVAKPWPKERAYERAREFLAAYLETWGAHSALFRIRNLASDEGDKRFSAARVHATEPLVSRITACIDAQRAQGLLPADLDGQSAAGALLALLERVAAITRVVSNGQAKSNLLDVAAFFIVLLMRPDAAGAMMVDVEPRTAPDAAVLRERTSHSLSSVLGKAERPANGGELNLHGQTMGAKGERTRARLLAATETLLEDTPLRELTVADITKMAQTSASTFYLYFQDVTEAVLALATSLSPCTPELLDLARRSLEAPRPGGAWALVNGYITEWRKHTAVYRVRNLAADHGDRRFMAARSEAVRPLLELIAERIAGYQARVGQAPDLDPVAAAAACLAMLERLAVTPHIRRGNGVTRESMGRVAAFMLDVLIGGVAVSGRASASSGVE